ncbi:MAG: class I SAM-dependent methyltransferase [Acidimicrobiia bacterium]
MTSQPTEARQQAMRQMWGAVAEAWGERAREVDEHGEPVTQAMLDLVVLGPGERVLELACGPGGVGLAAAERVGPRGDVLVTDIAEEMVAIAAERAASSGMDHVRTAVMSLDALDVADGAVDVVLCREGLMFAGDPARAASEMARVLRPGGRVAVAVWAEPSVNPWLSILLDSISDQVGMPVPPPGVPGPFSLADRDALAELFAAAGFDAVTVRAVAVPSRCASFEQWWSSRVALAGPVGGLLAAMSEHDVAAIRTRARAAAAAYAVGDGYELPGESLVVGAQR